MIRKYQTRDLEDVLSVWAAASAVAHPFLSEEFLARERNNISNVYLPKAETWVWESGGRIIGFISLLGNEVGGIFIDPKFHGTGIGRTLMDHIRNAGDLEVEVFKANEMGRAFYEKYGFVFIQEKMDAETGLNIIRLRLPANKSPEPRK